MLQEETTDSRVAWVPHILYLQTNKSGRGLLLHKAV